MSPLTLTRTHKNKPAASNLDPEQLAGRLAVLPAEDVLGTLQGLARLAAEIPRSKAPATLRFDMLESLHAPLEARLLDVDRLLDHADAPLPEAAKAHVVTAYEALKRTANAYTEVAGGGRNALGKGREDARHLALCRAMELYSRQLLLGYRAYAPGSGSTWPLLHRLHKLCTDGGLADSQPEPAVESPNLIYTKALLLGLAEPHGFAPGELDRVRFYVFRHAHLASLSPAMDGLPDVSAAGGRFLIQRNKARPGKSLAKWRRATAEAGDLVLDCNALLATIHGHIEGLDSGKAASWLGLPAAARRPDYLPMLRHLQKLWSTPPLRRHSRLNVRRQCEVACGVQAVWHALGGSGEPLSESQSQSLVAVSSEWTILNEGRDGFALRYAGGQVANLRVGELIALRTEDSDRTRVCVVRRSRNEGRNGLELGVQELAPLAVALTATVSMPSLELRPRPFPLRAIYLPSVPLLRGRSALLVAPDRVKSGFECDVPLGASVHRFRAAGYAEATSTWEFIGLEPVPQGAARTLEPLAAANEA